MKILMDINKIGKPSREARKIGIEAVQNEKIRKIAMFGLHPVTTVIVFFFMGFIKKKRYAFY
jgi:hypothetical protein